MDSDQSISLPSVVFLGVISILAVRYFFFASNTSPSSPATARQANPADVDQISAMFPQIPRRSIIWDLQKSGGSVAATTERILSGGTLDTPPPSFQPPIPSSTSSSSSSSKPVTSNHIDLIQRYNLSDKIGATPREKPGNSSGWSLDKTERQELMRRRREEMILDARRKLEQSNK